MSFRMLTVLVDSDDANAEILTKRTTIPAVSDSGPSKDPAAVDTGRYPPLLMISFLTAEHDRPQAPDRHFAAQHNTSRNDGRASPEAPPAGPPILPDTRPVRKPTENTTAPNSDAEHDSDDSDSRSSRFRLNLGSFAYASDSRSSSRASRPPARTYHSNSGRESSTPISDASSVQKARRARTKKAILDHGATEAEIASLTKCASCDWSWTTRKANDVKVRHMEDCAKKKGFDQETMRIRLRRVLDETPERPLSKGKSKGKAKAAAEPDDEPKTFMEEVVEQAAPKRKGRRRVVQSTVKDIAQTSDAIFSRLGAVLGRQEQQEENAEPPRTQPFGRSALAAALSRPGRKGISGFGSSNSDAEDDGLPLSQPLTPSKRQARNPPGPISPLSPSRRGNSHKDDSVLSVCPVLCISLSAVSKKVDV